MSASRNEITGGVMANVKGNPDKFANGWDRIFGKQPDHSACKKCGGTMLAGKAISQTLVGSPDFPGDIRGVTMSPGGPGELMDCLKCEKCGWSITLTPPEP